MESNRSCLYQLLLHWQRSKKSFYVFMSLVLICLSAYNSAAMFRVHVPFPEKIRPELASFSPEHVSVKTRTVSWEPSSTKLPSAEQHSMKEEQIINLKTHLLLFRKNQNLAVLTNRTNLHRLKRRKRCKSVEKILGSQPVKQFETRVIKFFEANSSNSSCKFRFFMTWISSMQYFGNRELLCIESLFKAHPNGCLIIASNSLDSRKGMQMLRPFSEKGFKVTAISPDFIYLFNNTAAQAWYNRLKRGNVNPGEVSLGQNLSNLLRMGLLYRFGGIYLDTDIVVLKSFVGLKNAIGAQAVDPSTRKWSRLNNAVMIFEKGHPLLHKFIEEFALKFDGNKWGYNGPYLVSRVISRLKGRPGFNITVLPPKAFYPVGWRKIRNLFQGPRSLNNSKWLLEKLRQIQNQSFAVHLWNKQSRQLKVEKGSIVQHILFSSTIIRNSSSSLVDRDWRL